MTTMLQRLLNNNIPFAVLCSDNILKAYKQTYSKDWFIIICGYDRYRIRGAFRRAINDTSICEHTMTDIEIEEFKELSRTGVLKNVLSDNNGRVYESPKNPFKEYYLKKYPKKQD